jgi:hypothetical protein
MATNFGRIPFKPPMFFRKWMFYRLIKTFSSPPSSAATGNSIGKNQLKRGGWLVLFDGNDAWQLELTKLIAQYRRPDFFCQTLGLVRHAQADLNSFHNQELTNTLLPPDRIVSLAKSRPFDICINLCPVENPPLEYLVIVSEAQIKIGVNRNQTSQAYNLELGLKLAGAKPSLRSLLQHLEHLDLHQIHREKLQGIHPIEQAYEA